MPNRLIFLDWRSAWTESMFLRAWLRLPIHSGSKRGARATGLRFTALKMGTLRQSDLCLWRRGRKFPRGTKRRSEFKDVTYPAGLSVGSSGGEERLLIANNNSDEAVLLNASDGKIVYRFDLSTMKRIPASLPYTTVMTKDGKRGFVSLWNASSIAELDLVSGRVVRIIPLRKPESPLAGGSHPTALLLNRDNSRLYVALTNRDEIAVLDTGSGKVVSYFSTKLPEQKYGGSDPEYLALSPDEKTLFSANAISDSVAVFDVADVMPAKRGRRRYARRWIHSDGVVSHGGRRDRERFADCEREGERFRT